MTDNLETAVFGGGCFWCTEAIFLKVRGVTSVVSGYAGGKIESPSYERVSMGTTGHAEVIKITFDPSVISYDELLEIFWYVHDPTTLNRQGADVGTQYRSIILYTSDEQRRKAEKSISKMKESTEFSRPIVTEIKPLDNFYDAESYHQNYFENNTLNPYCQVVIAPKLSHFLEKYSSKVKS